MRNVWTIASRELRSYFASSIAYILLAMFSIIFGYFFFSAVAIFVDFSSRGQMGMQMPPMNVDQFIIQPTLGNFSIILLFLSPMITIVVLMLVQSYIIGVVLPCQYQSWCN